MKPETILLPIDIARCPLEMFELVNGFAKRPEVTVILLHVLPTPGVDDPNRAGENRDHEARRCLQRLGAQHVHPVASTMAHIRIGKPAEEILAEAREYSVELIILPTYGPSLWGHFKNFWKPDSNPAVSPLAQKLIREATCGVFVVAAKTRLDFKRAGCWPSAPRGLLSAVKTPVILGHRPI